MRRHIHYPQTGKDTETSLPGDSSSAVARNEPEGESETLEIRLASPSDARMLAKLRYDFRSSLDQADEDEERFVQRCTSWMQARLQDGAWKCWIAERQRTLVGSIWAQLIEKIPNPTAEPEYHLYLTNLYVREGCRGKGIGSMLLDAAMAWGRTNDVHFVILWPTPESRPFYVRHGFSIADDMMQLIVDSPLS